VSREAFAYRRAADVADALAEGVQANAAFLAGGTDLLPLWRAGALAAEEVVDISRLPLSALTVDAGRLSLGALARLSDVAAHPEVRQRYPLIAAAIEASASGQVRNMATVGGNLLQRTRCAFFRGEGFACNKRRPDSGCGALTGETRQHAIFGCSRACVATHPSDLAVALAALDAEVETDAGSGGRRLGLAELYRLPADSPDRDTELAHGELITAVHVSGGERFASRSSYLKVRDRASFEFALVSVAAALEVQGGVVVAARLAAGGVAPRPWRLTASEAALTGAKLDRSIFAAAADQAREGAHPVVDNPFKIELLRRAVLRALETVGGEA